MGYLWYVQHALVSGTAGLLTQAQPMSWWWALLVAALLAAEVGYVSKGERFQMEAAFLTFVQAIVIAVIHVPVDIATWYVGAWNYVWEIIEQWGEVSMENRADSAIDVSIGLFSFAMVYAACEGTISGLFGLPQLWYVAIGALMAFVDTQLHPNSGRLFALLVHVTSVVIELWHVQARPLRHAINLSIFCAGYALFAPRSIPNRDLI